MTSLRTLLSGCGRRFLSFLFLLISLPAAAQLDEHCTVSLLNRSAQVRPDGSWRIDNVPANLGKVRVRATCVKDGVTVSGQSDYVIVQANTINGFDAEIVLGESDPIPESLAVTSPVETLTAVRRTAQLAVAARYPGGATEDVTASSKGTTYTGSNPAVASVSPEGLVTARRSGTVLVSAMKDGALAVLRLTVLLSSDGDGDGIPDETEAAEELDPADPLDALFDLDGDGLSNREEFGLGTRIRVADHDGDGIGDGEEVQAGRDGFTTSPLLRDTDGDVVPDGLEVRFGTDPNNAASVDLAAALSGLAAQPSQVRLVFNTALGRDVSQRVRIVGTLVDGSTADLTARGVAYASSDLAVVSFGAEAGRIFAGRDGRAGVTATLGRFQAAVDVTVRTFAPTPLSFLRLPGFANGVDLDKSFVYVASGAAGLCIVDISNLSAPVLVATVNTPGNANDVRISEGRAYVADGAAGLVIVDVGAPSRARIVGALDTPGVATDVAVREGVAYIADGGSGLVVADIQNPEAPVLLGQADTPGRAQGIDLSGSFAVVADGYGGVQMINVSNPRRPRLAGTAPTRSSPPSFAADVVVRGQRAYVADGGEGNLGGLRVIDLRVPEAPVVVASTSNAFGLTGLALDRDLAVAADFFFINAVPLFGLEVPALVPRGVLNFVPFTGRDDNGNGIAVRDGVLFLAATRQVIVDNGVSGDSALYIGRYALLEDTAGVPPTVRITAPVAETAARERTVLRLTAEAADDFGVAEVRFLVDGEAVFADSWPPYSFDLVVPVGRPSLEIGAEALDPGGNLGAAEMVSVEVEPDDAPAVRLLAPVEGRAAPAGTLLPVVAEASDDDAVTSVRFLADGVPWATDTEAPYRVQLPLAPAGSTLTLTAEATDNVGQTAVSAPVSVTVSPDDPPAVEILAPAAGARAVAGTTVQVVAGAADDIGVATVQISVTGAPGPVSSAAPYRFTVPVPAAGTGLILSATATDTAGQTASAPPVTVEILPDGPPSVHWLAPAVGARAIAGSVLRATVAAEDDVGVSQVRLKVDGVERAVVKTAPFEVDVPVPPGARQLRLAAVAVDTVGQETASPELEVEVTEDPGTTLRGTVRLPDGGPAVGALVSAAGRSIEADSAGRFALSGVPTVQVPITVRAALAGPDGPLSAAVLLAAPVTGGVSEVGGLPLSATLFDPEPGTRLALDDDDTVYVPFQGGFTFPWFGLPRRGVWVSSNGSLTFGQGDPSPAPAVPAALPGGPPRIAVLLADLVPGATAAGGQVSVLQLADRFVVTWSHLPQLAAGGDNTAQAILHHDGTVQLGYRGVTAGGPQDPEEATVAFSPGGLPVARTVDFSAAAPLTGAAGDAVVETFGRERPFDLDGGFLVLRPHPDGGFEAQFHPPTETGR